MKKVYQTIIDKEHGNCMQAVTASLFEMELDEVPNFIELEHWYLEMMDFYKKHGNRECNTVSGTLEQMINAAKLDGGINGYFDATVESKIFENGYHAVVVDSNLNIVHDPNPNGIYLDCTPEDVISIQVTSDIIIGKTGKAFTKEEWNNTTEKERELNTYKVRE